MNERFEELLPWYVNGSLGAEDRAWVDAYLEQNPDARDELAWFRSLQQRVQENAPAVPETASAPANAAPDDDFISKIEQTLAKSDGSTAPALSPSTQPIQLTPQPAQPSGPIPPENIPLVDGQGQPVTLPNDFLLLDTE